MKELDQIRARLEVPVKTMAEVIREATKRDMFGQKYTTAEDLAAALTAAGYPKLLAAVEAVEKLHFPEGDSDHSSADICFECRDEWPCPTIAALTSALGEGE